MSKKTPKQLSRKEHDQMKRNKTDNNKPLNNNKPSNKNKPLNNKPSSNNKSAPQNNSIIEKCKNLLRRKNSEN